MKSILYLALGCAVAVGAMSCNDSVGVGNSLGEEGVVIVVDSSYTITAYSQANSVVESRTLSQLIGAIDAPGFGSIRSDFVGQFMPSLSLDTTDITVNEIDSVKLFVQMVRGNFVGDSLVPMGMEVYRLTRDLPYPIYSDFDPEGYYDPDDMLCGTVYTASTVNEPDSLKKLSVVYSAMDMPVSFARELFTAYKNNPQSFSDPNLFVRDVFKGVYIKSSYGSGRISDFSSTSIRVYYHRTTYNTDSARYETTNYNGDYFAVAPEVVVNNDITYEPAEELKQMVADGEALLVAPAGYETVLRFPAPEIIQSYKQYEGMLRVVNSLTFTIPAEEIENEYNIAPPPYALLVLKSKKSEFFAKNSLTDNVTSFYAAYDSERECYAFAGMRSYLLDLLSKETITEDDYTFVLCPVQVNTEAAAGSSSYYYNTTSQVVTGIVPYVSKPAMARILPDKAKIKLTFSAGSENNL